MLLMGRFYTALFVIFCFAPVDSARAVEYTQEEQQYLNAHPGFTVCDRYAHFPLSGSNNGQLTGISGDIFRLISRDLGVSFSVVGSDSSNAFVENINNGRCDLVSVIKQGYEGFANIRTTVSTEVHQHFVAIGSADIPYVEELEDQAGNIFYVKELIHQKIIQARYPELNVLIEADMAKIFDIINDDHRSFLVLPNLLADYRIQEFGAHTFKVIDRFEELVATSAIGVNIETASPMLPILNKALQRIGEDFLKQIAEQYRLKEYRVTSYAWLWYVVFLSMLFILFLLFKNNRQMRSSYQRQQEMHNLLNLTEAINKSGSWSYDTIADQHSFSENAIRLFGFQEEEMVTMADWLAKVIDEDRLTLTAIFERALKKRDINETVYRIKGAENRVLHIHDQWQYEYDNDSRLVRIVGVITDISERVLVEQINREHEALLLHQNRLAQQGEMLQMIGHQWRQPLAVLSMNIQLVKKQLDKAGEMPARVNQQLDKMMDSLQYLSRTITDFKQFFSESKEKQTFKPADLLEEVFSISSVRLDKSAINIEKRFEQAAQESITTHKSELSQALLAIMNNAIDALQTVDAERLIVVGISAEPSGHLVIQIEDNAGGIPENIIDHIFDAYFSTKKELNGTGLGLYMTKMIVEKSLAGSIVVSNSHQGAVFRIRFPTGDVAVSSIDRE